MTGISTDEEITLRWPDALQWGPVVMTGIRPAIRAGLYGCPLASMGSGRDDRNQRWIQAIRGMIAWLQWGPVVVTGISGAVHRCPGRIYYRFNGVRSW